MENPINLEDLRGQEIPGRLVISPGAGGLPRLNVRTNRSTAEIYLHGAHVTGFQKNDEPPLLFMSGLSQFAGGKPIRGGVPICFPWFGPREGSPAHGFARLTNWELAGTTALPDGSVSVRLHLPKQAGVAEAFTGTVEFLVTVGETLTMELLVENSSNAPVSFEGCLHTYFTVGDISEVSILGLKGVEYLDKVGGSTLKRETADAIRINSEVDRVYLDTTAPVEIHDAKLRRVIRVDKSGSVSTVVWNPWVAKSKAMPDFGDEEFHQMVCVESGNVGQNTTLLAPGESSELRVVLSSQPL
jgi:glucose-6-phosphate 1-epimerase